MRILTLILSASLAASGFAAELQVAVAANFTAPIKQIATAFTAKTGQKVNLSFGASGSIYAQIKNGAPFEVFLSADQEWATKLIDEGLARKDSQFTYAIGKLALWSPNADLVDAQGDVLKNGNFKHLAIANPKLAPYGTAAESTLRKLGMTDILNKKLVIGENITQTFEFVSTGNAELGFVAWSQIKGPKGEPKGSYWLVPSEYYEPIKQDAVVIKKPNRDSTLAQSFLEFLKSSRARDIISSFGYTLP